MSLPPPPRRKKSKIIPKDQRVVSHKSDQLNVIKDGLDKNPLTFRLFLESYNIINRFKTPEIHIDIAEWIDDTHSISARLLQVFRHAGKSHLFGLYVAWRLILDPNYTCVILSAKSHISSRNSKMIRNILMTHPFCQHLRTPGIWSGLNFTVKRDRDQLDPSVTCTSLNSDFTGKHGDELILDDIETSDNCASIEARDQIRQRVFEFRKIASKLFFCGTPHHSDSIYTWLVNSYGVECQLTIPVQDKDGNATWPNHPEMIHSIENKKKVIYRKFSNSWIDFIKSTTPETDFKSQYMLIPCNIVPSTIKSNLIIEYNEEFTKRVFDGRVFLNIKEDEIKQVIGYLDTASGKPGRDKSVLSIVAVGTGTAPKFYIHRCISLPAVSDQTGWTPLLERTAELVKEHNLTSVCFEKSVNLAFESDLRSAFVRHGIICALKDVQRTYNKELFIMTNLGSLIDSGRIHAHSSIRNDSNFWGELADFPKSKHDDAIDATAGALAEIQHYSKLLNKGYEDDRAVFRRAESSFSKAY